METAGPSECKESMPSTNSPMILNNRQDSPLLKSLMGYFEIVVWFSMEVMVPVRLVV